MMRATGAKLRMLASDTDDMLDDDEDDRPPWCRLDADEDDFRS